MSDSNSNININSTIENLTPLEAQARLCDLRHILTQRPLTNDELRESVRLIAFQRQSRSGQGGKRGSNEAPAGNPLDFF